MYTVFKKSTGEIVKQTNDVEYINEVCSIPDMSWIHLPGNLPVEIYRDSGTSFSARPKMPLPIPTSSI